MGLLCRFYKLKANIAAEIFFKPQTAPAAIDISGLRETALKNKNPREGTETIRFSSNTIAPLSKLKNKNPREGTETTLITFFYYSHKNPLKNKNPREGTETIC